MSENLYMIPRLQPLPKKETREMIIEGTGIGRNNPLQTQIGDVIIRGEQYGDAPAGLADPKKGVLKRSDRKGYKGAFGLGFTLPGTATYIRNMVERGDRKKLGTNPEGWDEGDIGPVGRALNVKAQDLINRETDLRRMKLAEMPEFKNRRMAGTDENGNARNLKVYFGDTEQSLRQRLKMAEDVAQKKISEPARVQKERTTARVLTDNQNTALRSEENSQLAIALANDNSVDARLFREGEAKKTREFREDQVKQQRLDKEAAITRELLREKNQLARNERMDAFMIQKYNDAQDRLDRAEKREDRRALQQAIGAAAAALGSFF